jgi:hypothetical protein
MAATFSFSLATLALLLLSVSLSSVCGAYSALPSCPEGEIIDRRTLTCTKTAAVAFNKHPSKQPLGGKSTIQFSPFMVL